MGYPKLTPIVATGSSAARYLGDRFAETVNVLDYGARGDGVADDSSAFEAAIEAAEGKTLFIPDGTYKITEILFADGVKTVADSGEYSDVKPIYPEKEAPIKTLEGFKRFATVPPTSENMIGYQGLTYNTKTNKIVVAYRNSNDTAQEIKIVNPETGVVESTYSYTNLLHANTLTYCPETNKIYSLIGNTSTTGKVGVIDADTMAVDEIINLSGGCLVGLAYDTLCKVFVGYVFSDNTQTQDFVIYDQNFTILRTFSVPTFQETTNGICCHDGVIVCITWHYIRMISLLGVVIAEINYLGSAEPEDIEYVPGGTYIMNTNSLYYIYKYNSRLLKVVDSYSRLEDCVDVKSNANLNNIIDPGIYLAANINGDGNFPSGVSNVFLEVVRRRPYIFQTANRISDALYTEVYRRFCNNGVWTSWQRLDNFIGFLSKGFNYSGAGFITGLGKSLNFTLPQQRSTLGAVIELTSGSLYVRHNGQYLYDGSITDASLTVAINNENEGLRIEVVKDTAFTSDNNVCVSVQLLNTFFTFS